MKGECEMAIGVKEWPIRDKLMDFSDIELAKRSRTEYLEELEARVLVRLEKELRSEFEAYLRKNLLRVKLALREGTERM